jgi:hypothetical protein
MIISRIFESALGGRHWVALHFGFGWAGKGGVVEKRFVYKMETSGESLCRRFWETGMDG